MSLRKVLALTLVLCMVLSFFPVSAFADDFVIEDPPEETEEYITTIEEQPEEPEQEEEALVEETEQPEQEEELAEVIVDETEEPEEPAENPDEAQTPAAPEAENDKAEDEQPALPILEARVEAQQGEVAVTDVASVTINGVTTGYADLNAAFEAAILQKYDQSYPATIEILQNVDLTGKTWTSYGATVNECPALIVNGNGHTITGLSAPLVRELSFGNATVEFRNLTIASANIPASITGNLAQGSGAFIGYVGDMKSATFTGCHVTNSTINATLNGGGLYGYASKVDVIVTNCTVVNSMINAPSGCAGIIAGDALQTSGTLTITGTSATGSTANGLNAEKTGILLGRVAYGTASVNATESGNTLKANNTEISSDEIGTVRVDASVVFTQGGSYTVDPTGKNAGEGSIAPADGCAVVQKNGVYTIAVPASSNVAEIDGTGYPTLAEAIAAVTSSQTTITLLDDAVLDVASIAKSFKIESNGKTITLANDVTLSGNKTIIVFPNLTIDLAGYEINAEGSSKIQCAEYYHKEASLTIVDSGTGGKISGGNSEYAPLTQYGNGSVITLKNDVAVEGTYLGITSGGGEIHVEDTATVYGGTYGVKCTATSDGVTDLTYSGNAVTGGNKAAWGPAEVVVGNKTYYAKTVSGLVSKVVPSDGTEYTITAYSSDASLSGTVIQNGQKVVVDLNRQTSTLRDDVKIYEGHLTINNGTVNYGSQDRLIMLYASEDETKVAGEYNSLTIANNATVTTTVVIYPAGYRTSNETNKAYGTKVTINGTIVGTSSGGVSINGVAHEGNSVIDVNGTVRNASASAIYLAGYGTTNINSGASVTGTTGIEVRAGTLNVTGGMITGGTNTPTNASAPSGSATSNAGIAVAQHTTQLPISVNISGEPTVSGGSALYIVNPQGNTDTTNAVAVTVSGGNFVSSANGDTLVKNDTRATLTISGGTYSEEPVPGYIAEGYEAVENSVGTWTVVPAEPHVNVNTDGKETTAAFDAGYFATETATENGVTVADNSVNVSVSFDKDAAKAIAKNAKNGEDEVGVKLVINDVTESDPATNAKTFEITMVKVVNNVVTEEPVFSGENAQGTATVTVPFIVPTGVYPHVYLVTGETRTSVPVLRYTDTTVTFVAEHFSKYEVTITDWDADEITISTAAELLAFANQVNGGNTFSGKTIKLDADIDLDDVIGEHAYWTPIGDGYYKSSENPEPQGHYFAGTFDGAGHKISNLRVGINDQRKSAGLFGIVKGGTIKDLTVDNATVSNVDRFAGAIVGGALQNSVIESCHVTGEVHIIGKHFVGGLAGLSYGTIENCSVAAYGSISADDENGTGADGDDVGGLVGYSSGTITNGDVSVSGSGAIANLEISGIRQVGGLVGMLDKGSVDSTSSVSGVRVKSVAASDFIVDGGKEVPTNTIGLTVGGSLGNAASAATATDCTLYIATVGQLEAFRDAVNAGNDFAGQTVVLLKDINLENAAWEPIGKGYYHSSTYSATGGYKPGSVPFAGTFDGGNNTISNLNVSTAEDTVNGNGWAAGLFGMIKGGTVKNLIINNATVSSATRFAGAVAGGVTHGGVIDTCTVTGDVAISSRHFAGGVAGMSYGAIQNCQVTATGMISANDTRILADESKRDGDDVGGLVGYINSAASVTNSVVNSSDLTVQGLRQVGALVGMNDNSSVDTASTSNAKVVTPVASIEGTTTKEFYFTLEDAFEYANSATANTTIKLLADVTVSETITVSPTKTITFDLDGHTLTSDLNQLTPLFYMTKGSMTVKNSTSDAGGITGTGMIFRLDGRNEPSVTTASKLTLTINSGVNVTSTDSPCVFIRGYATLTTNGNLTSSNQYATIQGNGSDTQGSVINVNGGSVISNDSNAIFHPQKGTLKVSGGTVTGYDSGIAIKAGTLNVSGGTISATGPDSTPTTGWSNGVNASGAAIQIESNTDYDANGVSVSISGTPAIRSTNGVAVYEYLGKGTQTKMTQLKITGGTFNAASGKQALMLSEEAATAKAAAVSGGSFSSAVPTAYCAAGYEPVPLDPSTGMYTVQVKADDGVASITRDGVKTYYLTVQDALNAAQTGDTVVMEKDYSYSGGSAAAQLGTQKTITLDLNGHSISHTNNKNALNVCGSSGKIPHLIITGTGTISSNATAIKAGSPAIVEIGPNVTVTGNRGIEIGGGRTTVNTSGAITGTEAGIFIAGAGTSYANKILNVDGGTISGPYGIYSNQAATVNISNGEVTGTTAAVALNGYQSYGESGNYNTIKLNVSGGTIQGSGGGWAIAGSGNENDGNYEMNLSGGTITADDCAIYHCNDGVVNVSGTVEISGTTAIYQKSGTLNVSGGTINGTGDAAAFSHDGNGANATGDAIVVESCGYPGGDPVMKLTGSPAISSAHGAMIADYVWTAEGQAEQNPEPTITSNSKSITLPVGEMWVETSTPGVYEIGKAVATLTHGGKVTSYATLEAAFADAVDGDTITLLANCSGNGIKVPEGKFNTNGLTVDFGGFTYTVNGNLVGSSGTENQCFQLLKDNKVTFQNGKIAVDEDVGDAGKESRMIIQNYSDLTLDGMTLDGTKLATDRTAYTLSNNNGKVEIKNSTITSRGENDFAFDVCRYASYPSVSVTVTGTSAINGNVEISASGNDAKDGFGLTLTSGTMNGNIVVDPTATAAIVAAPAKVSVTRAAGFEGENEPAGYEWIENKLTKVFTVTFVTGEGASDAPAAQTVALNTKATKPENPTKAGFAFAGWFAEGATSAYTFGKVTSDITLTAHWVEPVVKVSAVGEDDVLYATLQDAFTGAKNKTNAVVTLLGDITLTKDVIVWYDCTLDLNGMTISRASSSTAVTALTIAGPTLTVKDSVGGGKITAANNAADKGANAIKLNVGSDLIINGGTFEVTGGHKDAVIYIAVATEASPCSVTINGGTFTCDGDPSFMLNVNDNYRANATYTVDGGTFMGFDPQNNVAEGDNTDVTAPGYVAIKDGNNYVVQEGATITFMDGETKLTEERYAKNAAVSYKGEAPTKEGFNFLGWNTDPQATEALATLPAALTTDVIYYAIYEEATYVAQVGETSYATLAEAVAAANAAENGATIQMLENVELSAGVDISGTVTLDLNGKTISDADGITTDYLIAVLHGGTLTVNDTTGDGKISMSGQYCAIKMTKAGGDTSKTAALIVNNGTIEGYNYGISGNGNADRVNTSVTINGGTITATAPEGVKDVAAIYQPQDGVMTLKGGTITGLTGVELRSGSLDIPADSTVSITGTGDPASSASNGNGTTSHGMGIAIAQHNTKKAINVNIAGGNVYGANALAVTNPQGNTDTNVTVAVSGGTFIGTGTGTDKKALNVTDNRVSQFISGGSYSETVNTNYCVDGFKSTITADENDLYSVVKSGTANYTASLTLRDSIAVNFYLKDVMSDVEAQKYTIRTTFDGVETSHSVVASDRYPAGGNNVYRFRMAEVFSYQMGDTIDIIVNYEGKDIEHFTYSVSKYFHNSIKHYESDPSQKKFVDVCKAGLDYGAAAQIYFDGRTYTDKTGATKKYNTNPSVLINADTNPENFVNVEKPGDVYKPSMSGTIAGISGYSPALILGPETSIKIYMSGNVDGVSITCTESKQTTPVTPEGNRFSFRIPNIKSFELNKMFTITITKGSETVTLKYSPYSYARSMWDNSEIGSLVKAMVAYGNKASQYFNS